MVGLLYKSYERVLIVVANYINLSWLRLFIRKFTEVPNEIKNITYVKKIPHG